MPASETALALVDSYLPTLTTRALEGDRSRRFPVETIEEFRSGGLAATTTPVELGGVGVDQIRDMMAVAHRIGQADASLGIAFNMHQTVSWGLSRAASAGIQGADDFLRHVGAGEVWLVATVTEAGTNYFHPATTLTSEGDDWILTGSKVFATGSPAATHFAVNTRVMSGPTADRLATVLVPAHLDGVLVHDDWHGLGMRASGSGQVDFSSVRLGADTVIVPGGPWGEFSAASVLGRAFGNAGNVAAIAGAATAARVLARDRVRTGTRVGTNTLATRPGVQVSLGELEAEHYALAAVLERLGRDMDRSAASPPTDIDEAHAVMARYQAAKLTVNRLSVSIVNRAMDLGGGASYVDDHPVASRYRDVRAGSFMQPFSPHEALAYLGSVAAGTKPDPLT